MMRLPKLPAVQQDPTAWREGFDAGRRGDPLMSCPYPATTEQALAWSSGYVEGKAARLKAVKA
ncbi:hypothetical protein D3C72_871770 [compost metagenome]